MIVFIHLHETFETLSAVFSISFGLKAIFRLSLNNHTFTGIFASLFLRRVCLLIFRLSIISASFSRRLIVFATKEAGFFLDFTGVLVRLQNFTGPFIVSFMDHTEYRHLVRKHSSFFFGSVSPTSATLRFSRVKFLQKITVGL